jgi:alpha-beta hydrolase superfamily lysophospholipase
MKEEFYHSKIDQQMLAYQVNNNDRKKPLFVIFHGMAEHKGRYNLFANHLISLGFNVLLIDHRGHGNSLYDHKLKGHFADHDGYLTNLIDLHEIITSVRREDQALFIFGHSMGSLFARSYLKRFGEEVDACILSGSPDEAPLVNLIYAFANILTGWMNPKKEAKFLTRMIYQGFNKNINLPISEYDWLSYRRTNIDAYIQDPLCGFNLSYAGFRDLMFGVKDVYRSNHMTQKPKTPLLFISGLDDPCKFPNGLEHAKSRMRLWSYENVSSIEIQEARHEWLQEENKDFGLTEIQKWLSQYFAF